MVTKRNQKKTYWEGHISRWQHSGLSKKRYCENAGISYWSFREWLKKLKVSEPTRVTSVPREAYPKTQTSESRIEIVIHEKLSIRIKRGYDKDLLKNLLAKGIARSLKV